MVEPETSIKQVMPAQIKKKRSFVGDVLKLVGGTTVAQVITVITAPILSRLYAPEAFGTLAVFVSMVGIIGVIICLRYELAIMLPERDEDAMNVLAVSLSAALIISGLSAVLIFIAHDPILHVLKAPDLATFLWFVPLALLIQGVFQALNYWNSRIKRFGRLSVARVSASVTTSAVPMSLAAIGQANTAALIGSWLAGTTVFAVVLGGQLWRDLLKVFPSSVTLRRMLDSLKRYRKFPLIDSWGSFINNLSWQLPSLMLSAFFSQTIVGYYSLSSRMILLPMTLVGHAIGQVFFQRASELRSRPDRLTSTVKMVFEWLVALGLLPALLLTVAGKELFIVIFGGNWAEAGIYAQILGLWLFFLFISSPLSNLFAVLEQQELALIVHVIILLTRIVALAVGGLLKNIYVTLMIWTASGVLVYGGLAIWNMRLADVPLPFAGRILLRYGLYSAPAIAILLPIKWWFAVYIWPMLATSAIVLVTYYLLILRQQPDLYQYLALVLHVGRRPGQRNHTAPVEQEV